MTTKLAFYRSLSILVVLVTAFVSFTYANAADEEFVTRVYPVADLIFAPRNYPFEGVSTEVPAQQKPSGIILPGGGGGGGMGGGFGGGGGGFGGGGFGGQAHDPNANGNAAAYGVDPAEPSIRQLTKVVQETVAANTWSQFGGPATLTVYGSRLIICQTAEVHEQIKKLLTSLRASGAVQSTVTIRAWWLRLDPAQHRKLLDDKSAVSPPLVNRDVLVAFAAEKTADSGEITCFDGQTVHIISGRFRNAIIGVTPVVGQNDLETQQPCREVQLASADTAGKKAAADAKADDVVVSVDYKSDSNLQIAANSTETSEAEAPGFGGGGGGFGAGLMGGAPGAVNVVGYQPQHAKLHAGALLEITPTRLQEDKAVVLDLKSKVSQWNENTAGLEFNNVVKLDQTSVISQQLSTTLKVPLGKPVLVGGLSLQPGAAAGDGKSQLYLIVEAVAGGN